MEYADENVVDVVIDGANFLNAAIARDGKNDRDNKIVHQMRRQYCLDMAHNNAGRQSVLTGEDKKKFTQNIIDGLNIIVEERRKLARLKDPERKINILFVAQRNG